MAINGIIDLRSDTLTVPTPAMREAMAAAEVGDDVFGEDPTVNKLQEMAAQMLGQEAGLLVSTGTMGNLASILAHCGRGDELICGDQSHIFFYEQGGMAALASVQPRTLPNQPDGTLRLEDIAAAIRSDDQHFPITRLVALETWLRERRPRHFVFNLDKEPAMLRKRRRVGEPSPGARAPEPEFTDEPDL